MSRTNSKSNMKDFKSKKPSTKSKRNKHYRDDDENAVLSEKEVRKRGLDNDPNWYFTDSTLANQASQLSFNHFLGSDSSKIGEFVVPTIAAIMLNPSPGCTYSHVDTVAAAKTSGFNMAMTKLYNRLSMKSGRNMAYAPQDVGAMVLAQGEIISLVTHVRRAFAIAQTYNVRNRMFPKNVIKALGFDPDDFFANFSDYRMRFNTLLASINQIPIITDSGYMRKCNAIYSGLYLDSENSMAQLYMFVPYSTWKLDETSDQRGTVLKTVNVCAPETDGGPGKVWNFRLFLEQVLEPMVGALLQSSTLNLVYADMLNLAKYESINFAAFEPIQDSDIIIPQHDLMVLKQIHNAVFVGPPVGTGETVYHTIANDVIPDPDNNCMRYEPAFNAYGSSAEFSHEGSEVIIDTDNSDPDLTERIEITRFTGALSNSWEGTGESRMAISAVLPDHYGVIWLIYGNHINSTSVITCRTYYFGNLNTDMTYWIEKFDWHPLMYDHALTGGYNEIKNVLGDLGAYTSVRSGYLRRLNQIIYMSLFDIRPVR